LDDSQTAMDSLNHVSQLDMSNPIVLVTNENSLIELDENSIILVDINNNETKEANKPVAAKKPASKKTPKSRESKYVPKNKPNFTSSSTKTSILLKPKIVVGTNDATIMAKLPPKKSRSKKPAFSSDDVVIISSNNIPSRSNNELVPLVDSSAGQNMLSLRSDLVLDETVNQGIDLVIYF
jgi:hypothetical protein